MQFNCNYFIRINWFSPPIFGSSPPLFLDIVMFCMTHLASIVRVNFGFSFFRKRPVQGESGGAVRYNQIKVRPVGKFKQPQAAKSKKGNAVSRK